uniref:BZIP domain-containing protein n=1 Tax=Panagrolaimus sp. PS1159 TaxID=55785 RepID=A0AC35G1T8_9BILA
MSQQQPQHWNYATSNSAPSYYPPYPMDPMIPPTQQTYYNDTNHNLYPRQDHSQSCPSIDLPTFEYPSQQQNYHYSTSNESSPSPNGKLKSKYPPVRKLTRASSHSSNCSTPLPTTASNGYSYPSQIHQQQQHQHLHPIIFPTYNPIQSLQSQDPTKPLYDGQKRGRKPKPDDYDEEKKLAKRNYGRHYRKNKTLEALKVQEKFKTTKFYMDSIKNWAALNGCMELAKLVEQHDKYMDDIEKYSGED